MTQVRTGSTIDRVNLPITESAFENTPDPHQPRGSRSHKQVPFHTAVEGVLELFLKALHPTLKARDTYFIRSTANCAMQDVHRDFTNAQHTRPPPMGALLALEDNTTLMVWPGTQTEEVSTIDYSKLPLPEVIQRGQVLVFHGSLVHAGSPYEAENTRIHTHGVEHENQLPKGKTDRTSIRRIRSRPNRAANSST